MRCFFFLFALLCSTYYGGVVTVNPNSPNYFAVKFDVNQDTVIRVNGLPLANQNDEFWVEKSSPIFESELVSFDVPFNLHNLTAYADFKEESNVIVVGEGNNPRTFSYFGDAPTAVPSTYTSIIPEPSTMGLVVIGFVLIVRRK